MIIEITRGVVVGLIVTGLASWIVLNLSWLQSWMDQEWKGQFAKIAGDWVGEEEFAYGTPHDKNTYSFHIRRSGYRVLGVMKCLGGVSADVGKDFDIEGSFKDLILRLTWTKRDVGTLESGTLTLKYKEGGKLLGHGLYFEPDSHTNASPQHPEKFRPSQTSVHVSLGIKSNTWNMTNGELVNYIGRWLDTTDVVVKPSNYFAAFEIELHPDLVRQLKGEPNLKEKALAKLTAEDRQVLGLK